MLVQGLGQRVRVGVEQPTPSPLAAEVGAGTEVRVLLGLSLRAHVRGAWKLVHDLRA